MACTQVTVSRQRAEPGEHHQRHTAGGPVHPSRSSCDTRASSVTSKQTGYQGRAAVRDEREGQSGQREQPDHAADDEEGLQTQRDRQTGGEQLAERVAAPQRDPEPDPDEKGEGGESGGGSRQSEFLADGGEDEIGRGIGDQVGSTQPQPCSRQAPRGHGEEALSDLVAAVGIVGERIEPGGDPSLDVVEGGPGGHGAAQRQTDTTQDVHRPTCRHIEHGDEDPEEEQRGAEVPLVDEDDEARRPSRQHRDQLAELGEGERSQPAAPLGKRRSLARRGSWRGRRRAGAWRSRQVGTGG